VWAVRLAATLGEVSWIHFFHRFILSLVSTRRDVIEQKSAELGHVPPVTLVVNPTMKCNLRCHGCYSFEFSKHATMEPAMLRRILAEAREMGTRFITLSGGEPFLYDALFDVVSEFHDMTFLTYTNGTLITPDVAKRIAMLGNLYPAVSVEGFEQHTDQRRGEGVHARVVNAMAALRQHGVMFGISATPTRLNSDVISSDAFLDFYIGLGATFVWLFTYIPVGRSPELQLMTTPTQRDELRRATLRWRETRPVLVGDFWNDGATCGGCLSASRYAFIAPDGKVQPCTFVHFYTHNLKEHTLREVFDSPFFQSIRQAQPYGNNLLRSCKIIDHPDVLRRLVAQHAALPSYPGAESILEDPAFRSHLDEYSSAYGFLADAAWSGPDYRAGHHALVPFSGYVDVYQRFPDRMAQTTPTSKETQQDSTVRAREVGAAQEVER